MGERARAAVPRKTPKVRLTRPGRSPPATAPAPAAPAPAGDGAPAVDAAGPDLRDMSDCAAARAAELEARLRELCDGYERLNRLALEAPLGLAAAARSHRAKLGGDARRISDAVAGWDADRHLAVLDEARDAKNAADARARGAADRGGGALPPKRRDARRAEKAERAAAASAARGDAAYYAVPLRRYRGGYHGDAAAAPPAARAAAAAAAAPPPPPPPPRSPPPQPHAREVGVRTGSSSSDDSTTEAPVVLRNMIWSTLVRSHALS